MDQYKLLLAFDMLKRAMRAVLSLNILLPFRWLHTHRQPNTKEPARLADSTYEPESKPFHPLVEEFKHLIEGDAEIFKLVNQALEEVPTKQPFDKDPLGRPQVRDYCMLLRMVNEAMTRAPDYNSPEYVLKGLPFGSIINWPMGTKTGAALFLNRKVIIQFDKILTAWASYLTTEASTSVLNDSPTGWLCPNAMNNMLSGSGHTPNRRFEEEYLCDASLPHYGFESWDAFFTKQFREGIRPVASPGDDNVIANACESAPHRIVRNVKEYDRFWLKSQPYSLRHMLADDDFTRQFVGGTVYQAFLSPETYHRWHSPVNGKVVKTTNVLGSSFSKIQAGDFDDADPLDSQSYITQVASRALIFIEADNPVIGLMCVMPVGMGECSSCEVTVWEGQRVAKGQQVGMFHFGGSTHCLFFRPGVEVVFDLHEQEPNPNARIIPINSRIATVGVA